MEQEQKQNQKTGIIIMVGMVIFAIALLATIQWFNLFDKAREWKKGLKYNENYCISLYPHLSSPDHITVFEECLDLHNIEYDTVSSLSDANVATIEVRLYNQSDYDKAHIVRMTMIQMEEYWIKKIQHRIVEAEKKQIVLDKETIVLKKEITASEQRIAAIHKKLIADLNEIRDKRAGVIYFGEEK